MTLIVERDGSLVEQFQSALDGGATVVETVQQAEEYLAASPLEYAVLLGTSVELRNATSFAERLRIVRPAVGVILVRSRVDSSVLSEALRSGMREVIESRDLTGLSPATKHAYQLSQAMLSAAPGGAAQPAPASDGKLFTVFSTKGGVGKTMVATNLAATLADRGNRVCVVDLDIQGGDVAIMLQLFPTRSLADLAHMSGGIDATGVESLLTEQSPGLSVLAAPAQYDEQVSPDSVAKVLEVLKALFDVVVVDTSGSFDEHALHALDVSDMLVIVGTLDIPALKSLKLATGTLDLLNIPRTQWRLVLNRADVKVGLTAAEYAETLGLKIAAAIPSSREVLTSINRCETVVRAHPRLAVSQTLHSLAQDLMSTTVGEGTSRPVDSRRQTGRRRLKKDAVR